MEDVLVARNRNNSSFNQNDSMTHTVLTREIIIVTGAFPIKPSHNIRLCSYLLKFVIPLKGIFLV